jgi:hypothetical protein
MHSKIRVSIRNNNNINLDSGSNKSKRISKIE